ncbi:MAG: LUD domain-containing protein [Spirochaetia bacterium]|jgi:L-lactate utilization protein LutC
MKAWDVKAGRDAIEKTLKALTANGIEASLVETGEEAKRKVLSMVPEKAEVFAMTSITLETLGIAREINESGRYTSVRPALVKMDQKTQGREMRKLGAAPDYALGSAHAVTETGTVIVASLTGSQLAAYASGAGTLIWVVGAQKIVKDVEEGMKRIQEYVVEKESARARKAYGLPDTFHTFPSKVLLFNREVQPGRVKLIVVNEVVGF